MSEARVIPLDPAGLEAAAKLARSCTPTAREDARLAEQIVRAYLAATPDPPKPPPPPLVELVLELEVDGSPYPIPASAVPAASPDERLREALAEIAAYESTDDDGAYLDVIRVTEIAAAALAAAVPAPTTENGWRKIADDLARSIRDEGGFDPQEWPELAVYDAAVAAGRAADRNTEGVWPDQSAMHGVLLDQIKDAYAEGIADTLDRIRVRAAEMLPEVARFTLDEIEALAAADREKPDEDQT